MKALRLFCLLPLSILCLKMTAQVEDLMRDKSIMGLIEVYNNIFTEKKIEEKIAYPTNNITKLELGNKNEVTVPEDFALQYLILKAIKANKLIAYKDVDCKYLMTYDEMCHNDTLRGNNFENIIVQNEPSVENIPFFRAHQVISYNKEKIQFGLRTLSIALMVKDFDSDNQHIGWKPAFWIKAIDLSAKPPLSDTSITWGKSLRQLIELTSDSDSIKNLNNEPFWIALDTLCQAIINKPNIPFYGTDSMRLNMKERINLIFMKDTISDINDVAHKIQDVVINVKVGTDYFTKLRIVQHWYWDDKINQLKIWLWGTAPMKKITNDAGELLYWMPFVYRLNDD
jgi:hypothetical protein